ncbi:hypothetical protein M3Y98_00591300 [Aphelenchoides besseyi]|nr:hypothetical protein M3Y98_00591300 [Aphelenchoides besseyi]KAI6193979.1 hypothetical protein M3Y96_01076300 [Aphelenchoides besseyi]
MLNIFWLLIGICGPMIVARPIDEDEALAKIPVLEFGSTIRFYANETWLHKRTDLIDLDHRHCVEGRVRVEGKRGTCLMDQYKSLHGSEYCHQFYPFYRQSIPYTLHVQFERRPRKFHDLFSELRYKRHRFGRSALREVASFHFVRTASCDSVCRSGSEHYTTQVPLKT